ncbi:serine hydrolase domain-containing protein [Actinomadura violacea]|uniref:Beta-lactamase family protein n=1 Tax=Actinomadura violacea TaxID=2819934 RepID=A0ABS3RS80_9ACTN|nr:serine hydrolase domain-containing protein [Actinomadura violacea]MBO2459607.1 beta-lactamase family protein [Actinomadura violacea]
MASVRATALGIACGLAVLAGAVPANADGLTAVQALQAGVTQGLADGYPAVIGLVRQGDTVQTVSGGVNDRATGAAADPSARFRIGSVTKTFIAATLLKLEAQGKLSLDDTVARWLPGVVDANGNDGTKITIRELLNMTSGLPEVFNKLPRSAFTSTTRYTPRQLLDLALRSKPTAAPGTTVGYTNTAYIAAGMIIQAVTGTDPATAVKDLVIDPLGLTETTFPTTDDMPGNYIHGYAVPLIWIGTNVPYTDVSTSNVTITGAAGAMISTSRDLAAFFRALMDGTLLPPAQRQELTTGVQEGTTDNYFDLGIETLATACGPMYVKNGLVPGYVTYAAANADGTKEVVLEGTEDNLSEGTNGQVHLYNALKNAYCAS